MARLLAHCNADADVIRADHLLDVLQSDNSVPLVRLLKLLKQRQEKKRGRRRCWERLLNSCGSVSFCCSLLLSLESLFPFGMQTAFHSIPSDGLSLQSADCVIKDRRLQLSPSLTACDSTCTSAVDHTRTDCWMRVADKGGE